LANLWKCWKKGRKQYRREVVDFDRHGLEEGEATARFAMDVATNHFNPRNVPTGYQAAAAGMPFPWYPASLSKAPRAHSLAYYYHLTGYRRAK